MRTPSVFVSSTCYDLKQVRTDIKAFLEGLGLRPVLSDFDAFPINPAFGPVDNCIKVVQERADILILIVGTRYGSTNDQGKSITNLEFLAARSRGIPIYVFVMRTVLEILPVWQSSPMADFSKVVDSPQLFQFVDSLKAGGDVWIFPFDTAQDIFNTLRKQFAYLFMDALELRHKATIHALSKSLRQLDGKALRIAIERPRGWEYLLFTTVLETELDNVKDQRRDWQYGFVFGNGTSLNSVEAMSAITEKFDQALQMGELLKDLHATALTSAMGPDGASGDPDEIVYVAKRVVEIYKRVLEWKLSVTQLRAPKKLERLRNIASCLCDNVVMEMEEYSSKLKSTLETQLRALNEGQPLEKVAVVLKLTVPDLSPFKEEMERVTQLSKSEGLADGLKTQNSREKNTLN